MLMVNSTKTALESGVWWNLVHVDIMGIAPISLTPFLPYKQLSSLNSGRLISKLTSNSYSTKAPGDGGMGGRLRLAPQVREV